MKLRRSLFLTCSSSFALVCLAFPTAHAGTTWDGGGNATTNIDTSTNWNDDINPLLTAGNQTLTFGTGGSTATINTDVNVAGIVINRDANFEIANGAGNLTIGTGGITVTLPNTTARTHTISESNLILSGFQTWTVTNNTGAAALNISSTISGVSTGFSKAGNGTLTLSGNNSFTGGVYAAAGYLNVNHNNALGANSGTVYASGYGTNSAVRLNGGVTVTGKTLQLNGLGLSSEGQLVVNDGTTNTWEGLIDVRGTTRIGIASNANSRLNLTGGITANGNQTFSLMNKAGIVSVTGSAINLGSGGTLQILASGGSGITRLGVAAGASNWGTTRVDFGGQLITDVANALAANALLSLGAGSDSVSRTGSLDLNGFNQTVGGLRSGNVAGGEITSNGTRTITSASAATLTLNETSTNLYDGTITGAVALIKNGIGTTTLTGNNTYSGGTTVNAGALNVTSTGSLASNSALSLNSSATANLSNSGQTLGAVSNNNTATNALNFSNATGTVTLASLSGGGNTRFGSNAVVNGGIGSGTVNAIGSLTANITGGTVGAASLTAGSVSGGTNNISGAAGITTLSGGTTTVGGVATIGTMSAGTANLNGATSTITTLSGGSIALGNSTVLSVSGGSSSGIISGGGGLNKTGAGSLELLGANTYTGTTTVSEGALAVNGSLAGGVTVINGATLHGNGTISGATTIGGSLKPGNSPGLLTFENSVTLQSTASTTMEIVGNGTPTLGVSYDAVDITGALVYDGTLTLHFSGPAYGQGGYTFNLFDFGSQSGSFTSMSLAGLYSGALINNAGVWGYQQGDNSWSFNQANGELTFTVVPEPNVAMVVGSLALMTLLRRRRD